MAELFANPLITHAAISLLTALLTLLGQRMYAKSGTPTPTPLPTSTPTQATSADPMLDVVAKLGASKIGQRFISLLESHMDDGLDKVFGKAPTSPKL